jgi:hypothetical protein
MAISIKGKATYSPAIITNGLVLCLDAANRKSYPGSGTVWRDLAGGGNNGTLTNGPTFNSANGGSIVFDGVNDFVNLSSALNFSTNIGFTMCLFLQQNTTQTNSTWNYFYSRESPQIEIGAFGISNTSFYFKDNTTSSTVTVSNVVTSWSYIAFGTNPTTRIPFIYGYNSSGSFFATSVTAFSNTTIGFERLFITGPSGGSGGGGTQYYGAKCAVISAYNRALTPQEVLQNYNATKGRYNL